MDQNHITIYNLDFSYRVAFWLIKTEKGGEVPARTALVWAYFV